MHEYLGFLPKPVSLPDFPIKTETGAEGSAGLKLRSHFTRCK